MESQITKIVFSFFLKIFKNFLILRERKGKEKERETSMCSRNIDQLPLAHPQLGTQPTTQARTLNGNRTGDPSVRRLTLSPLSHTSQG